MAGSRRGSVRVGFPRFGKMLSKLTGHELLAHDVAHRAEVATPDRDARFEYATPTAVAHPRGASASAQGQGITTRSGHWRRQRAVLAS